MQRKLGKGQNENVEIRFPVGWTYQSNHVWTDFSALPLLQASESSDKALIQLFSCHQKANKDLFHLKCVLISKSSKRLGMLPAMKYLTGNQTSKESKGMLEGTFIQDNEMQA